MAQRGPSGYGIPNAPNPFGGPSMTENEPSALDAIRQQTSKIEDVLDNLSEPIKPCVLLGGQFRVLRLRFAGDLTRWKQAKKSDKIG